MKSGDNGNERTKKNVIKRKDTKKRKKEDEKEEKGKNLITAGNMR